MRGRMKAWVFYEPGDMRLEEVDIPEVGEDQVLVRVKACGICGSDVAYYFGASSLETPTGKGPLILGHELTGEVVEVGRIPESLGLFKPGDRVVLDPVQYCNTCEVCKRGKVNLCENKKVLGVSINGGFAEYCVSNYTSVHKLPDNVTYEEGALTEPLADAVYAVGKMEISPGDFCVVIGPGPIGIMMVQLIKASGAGRVVLVGTRDYRLQIGLEMGADEAFNVKDRSSPIYTDDLKGEIERLTDGKFADAVVVATGSPEAMELALEISGRSSRIVYFGLPPDTAVIRVPALAQILWDKTIKFSWLSPLTWPTALRLLSTKQVNVDRLITHRYKLEQLKEALGEVRERKGNVMKAVVVME